MKCREGCEGEAVVRPVCWQCWDRLPGRLVADWLSERQRDAKKTKQVEREIRDWLAADDKRRGV